MDNQALSIECMLTLKDLGIDTSKASMYWDLPHSPNFQHKLNIVGVCGNFKAAEQRKYTIGAFTLQDILELLPAHLVIQHTMHVLTISHIPNNWSVAYKAFGKSVMGVDGIVKESLLQAAYKMLVWVAKNGYLNLQTASHE